jgi:hypothetical protein
MSAESWISYHQQRIQENMRDSVRRADLARRATVESRGPRAPLVARVVALASRLVERPRAARAAHPAPSQQPLR